ncbi:MAG: response regulator [Clostridia bacterium]|nr:response regulator [Deltaproteobacteria bacterium]
MTTSSLIARFISTARDRLTLMGEALSRLRTGDVDALVKRVGRDLHTLKGEARLLALSDIETIAHASEDMLISHHRASQITEITEQLLFEAFDIIFSCVQALDEGVGVSEHEIAAVVARLRDNVLAERSEAPLASPAHRKAEQKAEPKHALDHGGRSIHVRTKLLDQMTDGVSNLSGALVRNRQHLAALTDLSDMLRESIHIATDEDAGEHLDQETIATIRAKLVELPAQLVKILREFREHHFHLDLIFAELSEEMREARLQPLRTVFATYPTFIRNVAREVGKRIRVEISGEELGIDQRVLEELGEPVMHLLRNSVVHGIELPEERRAAGKPDEGLITITARQDGELIRIEFSDDGRGIDLERVKRRAIALNVIDELAAERMNPAELTRLVFVSGLSTAATTDELAGRGVGLDVVDAVIDRMNGSIAVESRVGVGTTFILQVPVSLSLTRALFLQASEQTFAVPNAAVVEVYRLPVREIRSVEGRETTTYRGKLLPLVRLREVLGLAGIRDIFVNKVGVVVMRVGDDMAGFVVDDLLSEREIVVRPFDQFIGRIPLASGVTLMENGDVVLVLHPPDLLRIVHDSKRARAAASIARLGSVERSIVYAEDSIITREYAAGVLRSRGYNVAEAADGSEALELMRTGKYDLLLTDLQMPRMDGFKLCAAVRKDGSLKNLPIVVMSTLDTPETKRMALDAGADAYLVKSSFAEDTLISTIERVIR